MNSTVKGCLIIFNGLAILGYIIDSIESTNRQSAKNKLEQLAEKLEDRYSGTFKGSYHSTTSIPLAGIYPGKISVVLKIKSFVPSIVDEDSNFYNNMSDHFATNTNHIEGIYEVFMVDEYGDEMYSTGRLYYYPEKERFCIGTSNNHNTSPFGGDICDIELTTNKMIIPNGELQRIK